MRKPNRSTWIRAAAPVIACAASLAAPAAAEAAPAEPGAAPAGSCYFYDNLNNQPGACQDETTNFSEPGVSIWNSPYSPGTVVGTGPAGQAFATFQQYVSDGTRVTCDSGVQTTYWYEGEYKAGGVTGWVPDCYLNGEPS
jgi:hypothetical protein